MDESLRRTVVDGASRPPVPANEVERLAALRHSGIFDTAPEAAFDVLTELAAYICRTPISTVTFVDEHRQWSTPRPTGTRTSRFRA